MKVKKDVLKKSPKQLDEEQHERDELFDRVYRETGGNYWAAKRALKKLRRQRKNLT